MSYNFDGKIANQQPKITNYVSAKCHCSKCGKIIDPPSLSVTGIGEVYYLVSSYFNTPHFIYETKKGTASVYCSDYCRKKHNHRFQK